LAETSDWMGNKGAGRLQPEITDDREAVKQPQPHLNISRASEGGNGYGAL